jgi:hypothetical protein
VRLAVVLVALVGCDYAFRLDEVQSPDGGRDSITGDTNCTTSQASFQPVSCGSVVFSGAPVEITDLAGSVIGDPSMRGDELEIYYTQTGSHYTIGYATRPTATSSWQVIGDAPFGDPASVESDPSISADGSYVAFLSDRGGAGTHAYLAHRACDTWETVPMPGLESAGMSGLDLSWDALALYFNDSSRAVYQAHRSSTSEPFGSLMEVLTGAEYPSISSDERELYVTKSGSGGVYRATRTDITQPFGAPAIATSFGSDADVSVDGSALVMKHSNDSVQLMRRTCP